MRNMKSNYLFLLILILTLSCEESDTETTDEPDNEIIDDYNLLAVSNLGEVFEIGNNTGILEKIGQIERENNNSILSTNNLIASNNKIYCIEYIYNPSPESLRVKSYRDGTPIPALITCFPSMSYRLTCIVSSLHKC